MERKLLAREAFMAGYNCCQSVVVAFADDIKCMDKETLLNLSSPFGAGFARTRNICGAVSGMGMIIGLLGTTDTGNVKLNKDMTYALVQKLMGEFMSEHHSVICQELLNGLENITSTPDSDERTEKYYKERPCLRYVESAVVIVEKYLIEKGFLNE